MTRAMLLRLFTMGVLTLLLLIPLAMVRNLVGERQARARSVVEDIAASSARSQQLGGPFLVLSYRVTEWRYVDEVVDKVSRKVWQEASNADRYLILQPETLAIQGQVAVDTLRRGIYETQRYATQTRIEGRFVLPSKGGLERRAD